MGFLLVCLSSLLFIALSAYVLQLLADGRRRLPPGPRPLPLIGNLLDVAAGSLPAHRSLARLAARHGPLMTVRLGSLVTVVASSPSTAREVLGTHNGSLTGRSPPDAWLALGHAANSVFVLPPRRRWRALRRVGAEHLLSARRLDGDERLRPLLRNTVLGLVRRISGSRTTTVEVGRAASTAVMDLQWRAMFSAGLEEDEDDGDALQLQDAAWEAVAHSLSPNISDFFPVLAVADLQGVRRRFGRRVAAVYRRIDEQIERRMRGRWEGRGGGDGEKDLLDVLLDMSEQDKGGSAVTIDTDVMRTFLTDIFLASVDTISGTVEWAMAELLQHPDTMKELQEELRSVLGSKTHVEHSDVDRLPYLRAVVLETLRLHPVVPLVPNVAEATVEINGHALPKGCTVLVNLWAVHRDPAAWPEPERFMPERFLGRNEAADGFLGTREFDLIPFSAGRRVCLGLPLATRMVHAMLGSLMHRFEWALPPGSGNVVDMLDRPGLTMTMATPLRAIAVPKCV